MVEDELRDPQRIAELLRAEIEGFADPPFDSLAVESGDGSAANGTEAFVIREGGQTVCSATKGADRLVLEFRHRPDAVADAADAAGLQTRPKATTPPATIVFVERAAAVKRVIDVFRATHDS
ncbi:hypothetical protein [Halodesulfurarchaeum sp.]|uniref:hypothetical protein n=1 Tax=Halodesulfurarchaeum sp. TaxID=1980530 RepID=UPI002FC2B62C